LYASFATPQTLARVEGKFGIDPARLPRAAA
jgi:hypothetical protein